MISTILVRKAPGNPWEGRLIGGGRVFRCALGRGAIGTFKREGDGATPRAAMRITAGYFRADRTARPQTAVAMRAIHATDGWCDAPADPNYNRPVRLPFRGSHEKMMRDDRLYDFCLVLDWNLDRVQAKQIPVRSPDSRRKMKIPPRGRKRFGGSAIFLHVAREDFRPTEGCIALQPKAMRWLLPRIGSETVVRVES